MTEKQLGQALLDLDLSASVESIDPKQLTQRILSRDERRVRRWTWITAFLWVLAALMVLWMFVAFGTLFPRQAKLHEDIIAGKIDGDDRELVQTAHQIVFQMISLGIAGSVGLLSLAALSALFLIRASRLATLRHINASLLEISSQLKRLGTARNS